jgi:hypothetical protein
MNFEGSENNFKISTILDAIFSHFEDLQTYAGGRNRPKHVSDHAHIGHDAFAPAHFLVLERAFDVWPSHNRNSTALRKQQVVHKYL